MQDYARSMMALFEGYADAHGTHGDVTRSDSKGGKLEIKATASTIRQPVTVELWEQHLSGERALGIIPIRSNDTCLWGVIDVDQYSLTHSDIVQLVENNSLPLVVCRSKSGGAHMFLFMMEPVSAREMRDKLRDLASLLGFGTSEIFPKQSTVMLDRGDLGSWLNMPYFRHEETERYAVRRNGNAMTLPEFLDLAYNSRISAEELHGLGKKVKKQEAPDASLDQGPPCLMHLASMGVQEGVGRNKTLFNMGILAKKKFGQRWQEVLETWNRDYMMPPLSTTEMAGLLKSLDKGKEYNYGCREYPLSAYCNSSLCRTRKFGVGGEDDFPRITNLSVLDTEPPIWFVDVDDTRLELSTDELQNYRLFHRACMERLHTCYKSMKSDTWLKIVGDAMRNCTKVEAPAEVSNTGYFNELVEDFVMDRHRGERREDILLGKPFHDQEEGRHYFRIKDLINFLDKAGMRGYPRNRATTNIRRMGGGDHFFNIKGKGVSVFWVPDKFVPIPRMGLPHLERDEV